ncbi:MAG: hypothetical protein PVG83_09510 [Acidimicrobiia bacterium]|jgi:hypothetical protein
MMAVLVLIAGCAPDTTEMTVVTTASEPTPEPLPDLAGPDELEETLISFGECVEESFPIAMRFRTDAFIGLETAVSSRFESEGDQVDAVTSDCNARFDLDRRLGAYEGQHELSQADRQKLVDGFVSCVMGVSPEVSDRVSKAGLETLGDAHRYVSALHPLNSGLTRDELGGISECQSEMTGPELVFAEGHPWFEE